MQYLRSKLPKYAVPVFLRVLENPSHIGNYKQNKTTLRGEGIDPEKVGTKTERGKEDRFLWLPPGSDDYVEFTRADWENLNRGRGRL